MQLANHREGRISMIVTAIRTHQVIERPEPSSRHPLIVFLVSLCVVSGITMIAADVAPDSIEAQLPHLGVIAWALALVVGGGMVLAGLILQALAGRLLMGVLLEYVGIVTMGSAAILYSGAVFVATGVTGIFPAAIVLGFGVGCLYRWWTLQNGLKRARKNIDRGQAEDGRHELANPSPRRPWRRDRPHLDRRGDLLEEEDRRRSDGEDHRSGG